MLSKIMGFITGDLGTNIVKGGMEIIKNRFPAKMSEAEAAQLELDLKTLVAGQQQQAHTMAMEEREQFNDRIKEMEGTASDLKAIPYLGNIIIFLRGVQRPAWGFAAMYFDFKWFTSPNADYSEQEQTALILINVLVLCFLFGERAIVNVLPIATKYLESKRKG
jgi:hypothetical protein